MIKNILILFSAFIMNTIFAQEGWYQQTSQTDKDLNKVFSYNENLVWIVGESGTILNTLDGGDIWNLQSSQTMHDLNSVHFINADSGWVVGSKGTILFTDNGGNEWKLQKSNTELALHEVFFLDHLTGWVAGGEYITESGWNGIVLYTLDGGSNWLLKHSDDYHAFFDIQFFDSNNGWIAGFGTADHFFAYSEDGGASWQRRVPSALLFPPVGFYFFDKSNGWIFGDLNGQTSAIFNTQNKGNNWSEIQFIPPVQNCIFFIDTNTGFIVGNGGSLVATISGGNNWIEVPIAFNNDLIDITFVDKSKGWIVGTNGLVLHTKTGTIVSVNQNNNYSKSDNISDFRLKPNYPNPFNTNTTISYSTPKPSNVKINIYNIKGQEIAMLINEVKSSGNHEVEWDGRDKFGSLVSSGIYYYRIEAGSFVKTLKMILLK